MGLRILYTEGYRNSYEPDQPFVELRCWSSASAGGRTDVVLEWSLSDKPGFDTFVLVARQADRGFELLDNGPMTTDAELIRFAIAKYDELLTRTQKSGEPMERDG